MFASILLICGVAVLGMAFRSFKHSLAQRLSLLCVLATSFLLGYLPSGSWLLGLLVASIWLLLPWLEILTRIRALRLPVERIVRRRTPPGPERFPNLEELTEEIETEQFDLVDDVGCDWDTQRQFLRLFHRVSDQTQAAVCLVDQGDIAFYYISLVTRARDGQVFTTWNYPFSYSLKFGPESRVCRVRADAPFSAICQAHRSFLSRNSILLDEVPCLEPSQIQNLLQNDLRVQINHNVAAGLLAPAREGEVRYTWRGLFYVWLRFLWDLVRL
jgi:hypothetical protein